MAGGHEPALNNTKISICKTRLEWGDKTAQWGIGWIARRLVQSPCLSFRSSCFCGGRRKEAEMLCPTTLVVDATENSREGGVVADVWLGYEQNKKAAYYCSYLGHQNGITFVGAISERCPTNATHHRPTFQCEAMRVSAKPSQSGWVGIVSRWVWVTE